MKKTLIPFILLSTALFADPEAEEKESKTDNPQVQIVRLSEAFGHLLGKNLGEMGVAFDLDSVIKGLKDAAAGKNSPMNESECLEALSEQQKRAFDEVASKNLLEAEQFLKNNAKHKGIVSLEKGKVQYKVLTKGHGPEISHNDSFLMRYTGSYLSGSTFASSKEEELVSLEDDIIPGLKKGLQGMKEGEKRLVYIHPELAFGTQGGFPPNTLLTFEVEVVKAKVETTAEPLLEKNGSEVSAPLEEQKSLR